MKRAEQVTFGGSGLDRAAHLRANSTELDRLWSDPAAQVLLLWRGKPLAMRPAGAEQAGPLAFVATSHSVLSAARPDAIFLGRSAQGAGYFAVDISEWTPPEVDLATLNTFLDPSEQRHPDLPEDHVFAELRVIMMGLSPREAELAATAKALLSWHASHRFCARCGNASAIEQAGWQRRCVACAAAHFPRTDPVVIMLVTRGDHVLLGRSPGWPEGMYSLLAGFVEPGETMEAAVRREVFEEAGVRVGAVRYLASQPWAFPMSLMFGCHGEAVSEEIDIDPTEIEEAFWLSRQDMMDVLAGHHPKIRRPRKGAIAGFLLENWVADTLG
ncbi:NAD(+) diphosphatase [Tritonibacter horizontis]|uniref:NAD(+) diphosphatase n=1 Tax=Tritonibacter horizontis TaxID=1768241 RepID=A0A132BS14_9RHOB|nr:NAD(+) diphosphatase [Tritonibacter horizontis]KUP91188.1 NADH pyrophosphatase [Tritonibacter horizontis]